MTPWLDDGDLQLYHGDVRDVLRSLPAGIAQTCVTSPPYWGLRDYGTGQWTGGESDCDHAGPPKASRTSGLKNDGRPADRVGQNDYERAATVPFRGVCGRCGARRVDSQLGLEATPDLYVAVMVDVFREVWRVLRDDGTVWLNLGDSYAGGGPNRESDKRPAGATTIDGDRRPPSGLKPKDLVGVPWRVAFALQADGWYLRSDIIWSKPNPMPESVVDRPTKAHEYLFLLAKRARYFYDVDAIREPVAPENIAHHDRYGGRAHGGKDAPDRKDAGRYNGGVGYNAAGRNRRSVWTVATEPFPEAHFATYPQRLVEPCILAGTSEHGECGECGAPWRRKTERVDQGWDGSRYGERVVAASGGAKDGGTARSTLGSSNGKLTGKTETTGWEPSCECISDSVDRTLAGEITCPPVTRPQLVLDPFIGSGTTALVARRLGRRCIGIDLSSDYLEIAARRTQQLGLLGGAA